MRRLERLPRPDLRFPRGEPATFERVATLEEAATNAVQAAAVLVAVATGLLLFFWTSPQASELLGLLGLSAVAGALALSATQRMPWRHRTGRVPRLAGLALVLGAGLVGTAWAAVPVVLAGAAQPDRRAAIVVAMAVTLANVYRLGPIRAAGVAYALPICAGCCIALARDASAGSLLLAAACPLVTASLLDHCRRLDAAFRRRIHDEARVREQHAMIQDLLLDFDEGASDWLWRTDDSGRVCPLADNAEAGETVSFEPFVGQPFATVFGHRKTSRATNASRAILAAMAARKPFRNQLVEIPGDEGSRWWRLSGKPAFDEAGRFAGFRGVGSDMTGARNSESRIAYLADFDALTGFANRSHFRSMAQKQCALAAADGRCRALLCLDLDGFKSVNDGLGHNGGDELLKQVAARLTALAPPDTFLARLGGDEFALWLDATTPAKAEAIAHGLVDGLAAPFVVDDANVEIGASVGIAFAPKHSLEPDDLMVKADLALYQAKNDGKGRTHVFVEALETSQIERRKIERDLKLALARGEFELHYQPIVDVIAGRVVSFEALIRWRSPDRGFVSPGEFIPVAEAAGLIVPIGRWALATACREAAGWPDDVRVAVNVSPPQVRASDFLVDVAMALKTSGLHPSRLEIEVTEGVLLDKSPVALTALRTLRDRGIGVALDDFGTGYSSLNYLIDFPVAKIKIDRSFVTDLPRSETVQAVVDAMLALARKLSIHVVAEGVETKEQALALKRRRCDTIQGYLFSKPRPAADVPEMIAAVPRIFQEALPTHVDSPLALALAARRPAAEARPA